MLFINFVWCDYLIQPAWWQVGFTNVAGPFTQARYKFILDYYGDVDLFELGMIDPNTGYSMMVTNYMLSSLN